MTTAGPYYEWGNFMFMLTLFGLLIGLTIKIAGKK
jgi:hypothetical protein